MARRRTNASHPPVIADPLARRWRKLARHGEYRKAANVMRELIFRDHRAAQWVKLGALLQQAGRHEQAIDAYRQGAWLFKRAGQAAKSAVIACLIARADAQMAPFAA